MFPSKCSLINLDEYDERRGCREIPIFNPLIQKKEDSVEFSAFWHLFFHGIFFFSTTSLIFGRKIPLFSFLGNAFC